MIANDVRVVIIFLCVLFAAGWAIAVSHKLAKLVRLRKVESEG